MAKAHLRREVRLGRFVQDLVDGAIEVMEQTPPESRRAKLEARVRQVIGVDMEVAPDCGLSITCKDAVALPVWSSEAQARLEEGPQS